MQAELWLLLAQCVSHPGDAHFLPYREKCKPAIREPFLCRYYLLLVTFGNVSLEQTWKQHCCASVEPRWSGVFKKLLQSQAESYYLQVNVKLHAAFLDLDHLSLARSDMSTVKCSPIGMFQPHAQHISLKIISHSAWITITNVRKTMYAPEMYVPEPLSSLTCFVTKCVVKCGTDHKTACVLWVRSCEPDWNRKCILEAVSSSEWRIGTGSPQRVLKGWSLSHALFFGISAARCCCLLILAFIISDKTRHLGTQLAYSVSRSSKQHQCSWPDQCV